MTVKSADLIKLIKNIQVHQKILFTGISVFKMSLIMSSDLRMTLQKLNLLC